MAARNFSPPGRGDRRPVPVERPRAPRLRRCGGDPPLGGAVPCGAPQGCSAPRGRRAARPRARTQKCRGGAAPRGARKGLRR
eukprot:1724413-Alexandrium_andersonii.AAC.1